MNRRRIRGLANRAPLEPLSTPAGASASLLTASVAGLPLNPLGIASSAGAIARLAVRSMRNGSVRAALPSSDNMPDSADPTASPPKLTATAIATERARRSVPPSSIIAEVAVPLVRPARGPRTPGRR